jgi:biopolymer transport protein ExbB
VYQAGLKKMMRQVSTMGLTAGTQRLVAAAAVSVLLGLGAPSAFAQAAGAPAAQPAQPAQPPAAGAPPANGEETPPPPPAVGPDGNPVAPPATDPAAPATDPAAPAAPAAEAPAAEGEKPKEDGALHDLSPVGMFMQAHIVVKAVMLWLVAVSIITWALFFSKLLQFSGLNGRTDRVLREFRDAKSLQDAAGRLSKALASTPAGRMLLAAVDELRASGSPSTGEKRDHLTSRISTRMAIAQAESNQEIGGGMQIFATTGSISPFVGLFGTVWGIMNSFIGIAQTQTTNLAVVAPGIAEALFATAIGLFAAIPAVIFYNIFARRIAAYNTRLENFSGEVLVRMSRQLDAGA